MPGTLEDGHSI